MPLSLDPRIKKTGSVVLETVRGRLALRVISIDVFEAVAICPVWCIGVAACRHQLGKPVALLARYLQIH
jgi:hypothetical protein